MLRRWSSPREYRMKSRDAALAWAGVVRARKAEVITESVARDLLGQLKNWAD